MTNFRDHDLDSEYSWTVIGSALPLPEFLHSASPSTAAPPLKTGGLPLPKPRAHPQSLRCDNVAFNNHSGLAQVTHSLDSGYPDDRESGPSKRCRMSAPSQTQSGTKSDVLVRVKQSSSSSIVLRLWSQIVELLTPYSQLIRDVMASAHKDHHVARILDNFAATTLAKYFQSIVGFIQACHSLHIDLANLTPVQLADALLAMRLARSSDGIYPHGSTILKSIRWSVRHLGADCFQCSFDSLLSKFLTDKKAIDKKESLPLPLFSILHWEKKILTSSTSPLLIIILGAFLFQLWTGLRWSDMQRIAPQQMVFDYQDIRGIAWRTKTTTKGQAFGCLASGFMSLDSHTWLLIFFRALDTIFSKHGDSQLDFMIPRITMKTSLELVLPLEPMRYTDALFYLRTFIQIPWRSAGSGPFNPSNYTIHGLKATFLSWSSQIPAISEEQRRQQGHHRSVNQSVRLYSRDDVYPQLQLQQILIDSIATDFRPKTPIHRGGQTPAIEPAIKLERYQKAATDFDWKFFFFPRSPGGNIPARMEEILETIDIEDESASNVASTTSASSDSSSSSSQHEEPSAKAQPANVDGSTHVLAQLRQTIHVVATWNAPSGTNKATRMACGRQFLTSSLKMVQYADLEAQTGSLCNHPGCRHIWSRF